MTIKTCSKCGFTSDRLEDFRKDNRKPDGRGSSCKECARHESEVRRIQVQQFIFDSKSGKPCAICGGKFHPVILDYHHLDPSTKEFGIGEGAGRSRPIAIIQREMDKCILICSNCHRLLHYEQEEYHGNKTDKDENQRGLSGDASRNS